MKIQGICALASAANSVSATIKKSRDSLSSSLETGCLQPYPVDDGAAEGAGPVFDVVFGDCVAVPPDDELFAAPAERVLSVGAGDVPHVDIPKTCFESNLAGLLEGLCRRAGCIGELIRRIKGAYMPGRFHAQVIFDELGNGFEFLFLVVVARNDEGGQFYPDTEGLVHSLLYQEHPLILPRILSCRIPG